MIVFQYILGWILAFAVTGTLYYFINLLLCKKFNKITGAIFTFIAVGLFAFLTASYLIKFANPSVIYLPFLFFWLVFYVIRANKS